MRPYRTKFGLDFAAGQAVFAPGFGSAQGAQFLASDMLGNHMLYFAVVARNFSGIDDVFDSFAGQVMYLNLSRRVNWGVGAFRWNGRFVDAAWSNIYQERTAGGSSWRATRSRSSAASSCRPRSSTRIASMCRIY